MKWSGSPGKALDSFDVVEVKVAGGEWQPMLRGQAGNPEVILRDAATGGFQLVGDARITPRRFHVTGQCRDRDQKGLKAREDGNLASRAFQAKPVFSHDNQRDDQRVRVGDEGQKIGVLIEEGRESIGVPNHVQSFSSTRSH